MLLQRPFGVADASCGRAGFSIGNFFAGGVLNWPWLIFWSVVGVRRALTAQVLCVECCLGFQAAIFSVEGKTPGICGSLAFGETR